MENDRQVAAPGEETNTVRRVVLRWCLRCVDEESAAIVIIENIKRIKSVVSVKDVFTGRQADDAAIGISGTQIVIRMHSPQDGGCIGGIFVDITRQTERAGWIIADG